MKYPINNVYANYQPIFLIDQMIAICEFEGIPYQMSPGAIDRAWSNMFVREEEIIHLRPARPIFQRPGRFQALGLLRRQVERFDLRRVRARHRHFGPVAHHHKHLAAAPCNRPDRRPRHPVRAVHLQPRRPPSRPPHRQSASAAAPPGWGDDLDVMVAHLQPDDRAALGLEQTRGKPRAARLLIGVLEVGFILESGSAATPPLPPTSASGPSWG